MIKLDFLLVLIIIIMITSIVVIGVFNILSKLIERKKENKEEHKFNSKNLIEQNIIGNMEVKNDDIPEIDEIKEEENKQTFFINDDLFKNPEIQNKEEENVELDPFNINKKHDN